ncbi:MAG: helix-turn-helix transcriptional regulator [Peptostreptococcaceae bacterium]|jgi:transcriptional regulator with XRE-family HTH domain|uniref:helix-turn-helix domain-containing protein n=1 Tax=Intestinibacter bartlettii TaxID=261299 RepID=UPI000823417C|nr:helix-turn-helix transcriptional regulator [Intestinibacter bartlettii]MDU1252906.1 helix-turn-helix transcriptional regulator [Peptostreptococcaceae bacterium]SCI39787.1 HTH-type transcriptional regulator immR [uncultured Clostridium sp.]
MNNNIFSKRLRLEREKLGLKQKEMANKLCIPPTTYNGYETGNRMPALDVARDIADALNVTTDYLLGRTNERNPKKERFQDVDTIAAHRIGNIEQLSDEGLEELDNYIELLKLKYKK